MGQVLGGRLDPRPPGVLLQPLRRAPRGAPAGGGQLLPEALLPPSRHAAVGRRAGLSAAGQEGDGVHRQGHPGRPLSRHPRLEGDGDRERHLLQGPREARLQGRRAAGRLRRRLHLHRQRRSGLLVPHRSRRAARPGGGDRSPRPRAREVARADPAGRRHPAGGHLPEPQLRGPVSEGRPRAGAAVRPHGQAAARGGAARPRLGGGVLRPLPGPRDLLRLLQLHGAGHDLPLRPGDREDGPSSAVPRSRGSMPASSRPARSSTRARTAPACRCSSPTRRG